MTFLGNVIHIANSIILHVYLNTLSVGNLIKFYVLFQKYKKNLKQSIYIYKCFFILLFLNQNVGIYIILLLFYS